MYGMMDDEHNEKKEQEEEEGRLGIWYLSFWWYFWIFGTKKYDHRYLLLAPVVYRQREVTQLN